MGWSKSQAKAHSKRRKRRYFEKNQPGDFNPNRNKRKISKVKIGDNKYIQFQPPPVKQLPDHSIRCDCGGTRQCFYTGEKLK